MHNRFARIELAIGKDNVRVIANSHIAVLGLGAVGGFASEALTRTGAGKLRIIDVDTYQRHNINRQIYATEETLGLAKVEAAKQRMLEINPRIRVEAIQEFVHVDTVEKLLPDTLDFVVDATDSVGPKIELLAYCHSRKIPVISAMGAALKYRYDLIEITDFSQTLVCPLARAIRKGLRKHGIREGIPVVYSPEPGPPWQDPSSLEDPSLGTGTHRGRPRRILGSLCPLAGVMGMLCAHYVIHRLIGTPEKEFLP